MGLEKTGLDSGKKIIAWIKTSGEGLLARKPVKISTEGLRLAPKLEDDVVQISKPVYCYSSKRSGGLCFADVPEYYKINKTVHIEEEPEYWTVLQEGNRKNGRVSSALRRRKEIRCDSNTPGAIYHPSRPAYDDVISEWASAYHIDKLSGKGDGCGTSFVQSVVLRSLNDPETAGRVYLEANCIDGKTHPAGFYYKLGFRHTVERENAILEKWLKEGGKREDAPFSSGIMYLPKENIEHCLGYRNMPSS